VSDNEGDGIYSPVITDLTDLGLDSNEIYICDNEEPGENIRLVPYYDVSGKRLTRGKLWQCPRCGLVKDTEMDNLQRPEIVVNKAKANRFVFESLGTPQLYRSPHQPVDVDPQDDEAIKSMGGHILHTKIQIHGKTVRND